MGLACIVVGIRWFNSQPYAIPTRLPARTALGIADLVSVTRTMAVGVLSALVPMFFYRLGALRRWRREQLPWLGDSPVVDLIFLLAVAWVPRMRVALHWAGVEILKREQFGTSFVAEAKGRLELPGGILLTGKIDRVDRTEAGEIMVIDYKTGSPPTKARVRALDANQLALGLAMAVAGVLIKQGQALPGGAAATIEYWQLQGARKAAGTIHAPLEGRDPIDAAAHVAAAVARAGELAAHYLLSENPFEPKLRPEWAWGDYDHLARVPEWISRPRSAA
jgi:hypothetical protein